MVLNINLFESFDLHFKCFKFWDKKKSKQGVYDTIDKQLYNVSREYKISILPINPNFDIENLYPITDHVELWNIFIVGNDKTYILANVNDPHIIIPNHDQLKNRQGNNILPDELYKVFDSIWTKTLHGNQLQFYMVWNAKLYFINTYPFFNGKQHVIGAILLMRAFETMPEMRFTTLDGNLVPVRYSEDRAPPPKARTKPLPNRGGDRDRRTSAPLGQATGAGTVDPAIAPPVSETNVQGSSMDAPPVRRSFETLNLPAAVRLAMQRVNGNGNANRNRNRNRNDP